MPCLLPRVPLRTTTGILLSRLLFFQFFLLFLLRPFRGVPCGLLIRDLLCSCGVNLGNVSQGTVDQRRVAIALTQSPYRALDDSAILIPSSGPLSVRTRP